MNGDIRGMHADCKHLLLLPLQRSVEHFPFDIPQIGEEEGKEEPITPLVVEVDLILYLQPAFLLSVFQEVVLSFQLSGAFKSGVESVIIDCGGDGDEISSHRHEFHQNFSNKIHHQNINFFLEHLYTK